MTCPKWLHVVISKVRYSEKSIRFVISNPLILTLTLTLTQILTKLNPTLTLTLSECRTLCFIRNNEPSEYRDFPSKISKLIWTHPMSSSWIYRRAWMCEMSSLPKELLYWIVSGSAFPPIILCLFHKMYASISTLPALSWNCACSTFCGYFYIIFPNGMEHITLKTSLQM